MKRLCSWIALSAMLFGCAHTTSDKPPQPASAPGVPGAMIPKVAGVEPAVAADPSFVELRGALLPGIPPFPAYPGATLVGSAERNLPNGKKLGHTIKWTTTDSVAKAMAWYQTELPKFGWTYTPPSDGAATEQTARIRRGNVRGSINVEAAEGVTEIEVDLGPQ